MHRFHYINCLMCTLKGLKCNELTCQFRELGKCVLLKKYMQRCLVTTRCS